MFAAVFILALVAIHVTAEIPSYIHVCGRRDPNINQCIVENVNNLKSKICEGIPELDVLPNDPFLLDKLIVSDTDNSKLYFTNLTVGGLCDFVVKSLNLDVDKLHADIELLFNRIEINATYHINVRVLVPIALEGEVFISTDNIAAESALDLKTVMKSNKKYIYVSMLKVNLDIKDYDAKYNLNDNELSRLHQIIDNFIGSNKEEVLSIFKPAIEEAVIKRIIFLSNSIVKHFTYEELFPDRT